MECADRGEHTDKEEHGEMESGEMGEHMKKEELAQIVDGTEEVEVAER
jgi:hypothetical protein